MTKEYVEERYNLLFELYGVQSRGWSMLHEQFNRYVFCPDNRKSSFGVMAHLKLLSKSAIKNMPLSNHI